MGPNLQVLGMQFLVLDLPRWGGGILRPFVLQNKNKQKSIFIYYYV